MSKYIIIQTWNGEGYSYQNKAEVKEFAKPSDARDHIFSLLRTEDCIEATITSSPEEGCITYEGENQDSGTYQYRLLQEGDYGVVITCNINEAIVVDKDDFEHQYSEALSESAINDGDVETEDGFVFVSGGEYDYSFIVLKP